MINRCANPNADIFVEVHSQDGDFCPFDQQSAHDIFYVDDETGHRTDILSKALIEKVQSVSDAMLNHPILSPLPDTPQVPEQTQAEVGVKSRYISSLAEQSRYNNMLNEMIQDDNRSDIDLSSQNDNLSDTDLSSQDSPQPESPVPDSLVSDSSVK